MAFEGLSEKLQGALKKMTGRGRLNEQAVKEGMREVRMALLEADVNYAVAKDFIRKVTDRCIGSDVLSSLTPSQQVIKIVQEEMTELMGSTNARLNWSPSVPTIFMLCGLQGAGKTTMCAKLAGYLIKQGKSLCWPPVTSTVPQPSGSCRLSESRSMSPFLKKERRIRSKPPGKRSIMPVITAGMF
jgi:signal recognition particle subunit FFH/SRP54 (srp54)